MWFKVVAVVRHRPWCLVRIAAFIQKIHSGGSLLRIRGSCITYSFLFTEQATTLTRSLVVSWASHWAAIFFLLTKGSSKRSFCLGIFFVDLVRSRGGVLHLLRLKHSWCHSISGLTWCLQNPTNVLPAILVAFLFLNLPLLVWVQYLTVEVQILVFKDFDRVKKLNSFGPQEWLLLIIELQHIVILKNSCQSFP